MSKPDTLRRVRLALSINEWRTARAISVATGLQQGPTLTALVRLLSLGEVLYDERTRLWLRKHDAARPAPPASVDGSDSHGAKSVIEGRS
jgi:hypothetical protein